MYYQKAELQPEVEDDGNDNMLVQIGDDVEISSDEAPGGFFLAQIESLFQEQVQEV